MNRYDKLIQLLEEQSQTILDLCEVFGSEHYLVGQHLNIENNYYNEIKKIDKLFYYQRKNQEKLNSYNIHIFINW